MTQRGPLPNNGSSRHGSGTSVVPRQWSILADLCLCTAEVCNQKEEVGEGADEGAERLPTDFYKDLECFCLPSVPIVSMGYDQKHFCHGRDLGMDSTYLCTRLYGHCHPNLRPFTPLGAATNK